MAYDWSSVGFLNGHFTRAWRIYAASQGMGYSGQATEPSQPLASFLVAAGNDVQATAVIARLQGLILNCLASTRSTYDAEGKVVPTEGWLADGWSATYEPTYGPGNPLFSGLYDLPGLLSAAGYTGGWHRRRPREFGSMDSADAPYGEPAGLGDRAIYTGNGAVYVRAASATGDLFWAASPGFPPDVLDSETSPGFANATNPDGPNYLTGHSEGDYVGDWIFDQLEAVYPLFARRASGIVQSTNATGKDLTTPGNEPAGGVYFYSYADAQAWYRSHFTHTGGQSAGGGIFQITSYGIRVSRTSGDTFTAGFIIDRLDWRCAGSAAFGKSFTLYLANGYYPGDIIYNDQGTGIGQQYAPIKTASVPAGATGVAFDVSGDVTRQTINFPPTPTQFQQPYGIYNVDGFCVVEFEF